MELHDMYFLPTIIRASSQGGGLDGATGIHDKYIERFGGKI
jgi:hypothetical protein